MAPALLPLKGLLPDELAAIAVTEGARSFAGRQILNWLYRRNVPSFAEMTNLKKGLRERLATRYRVSEGSVVGKLVSTDGTTKLLVELSDGARVESVIIPEPERTTLCVSTQVGCGRACAFCATARLKVKRNLTAAEILEQVVLAGGYGRITNVVFMGMGEPLDNYDAVKRAILLITAPHAFGLGERHVTISTVGVVPGIRKLAEDGVPGRLTVSLAAPSDELRSRLQPVNRQWNIEEVVAACLDYTARTRRDVTIAYPMIRGINDEIGHAIQLAWIARRLRAKVNLIPHNPAVGSGFAPPPDDVVFKFQSALKGKGVLAFMRRGRGGDISAACGQLAGRFLAKESSSVPATPASHPDDSVHDNRRRSGLPGSSKEKLPSARRPSTISAHLNSKSGTRRPPDKSTAPKSTSVRRSRLAAPADRAHQDKRKPHPRRATESQT